MLLTNEIYQELKSFAIYLSKNYGEDILQNALTNLFVEGKLQNPNTTISYIRHRIKMEANHFINQGKSMDSLKRRKRVVSLNSEIYDNNDKIQLYETIADKNVDVENEFLEKEKLENIPKQLEFMF
jgi:hypothetical protein